MNIELRDKFLASWEKYFGSADLPICLFYSGDEAYAAATRPSPGRVCMLGRLAAARKGETVAFSGETLSCAGGKRYLGFSDSLRPDFEYFLSCGIPGKLEGERYKKTPEIVRELMQEPPPRKAPAKYAVFKRWDKLEPTDEPEIVVFFATPDVLSGLFTLAGFGDRGRGSVVAPFGSGCSVLAQYPHEESFESSPRAVLGMFDVSARPFVPEGTLSFAVPIAKFARMVDDMDQSFLITESWAKVRARIEKSAKGSQG